MGKAARKGRVAQNKARRQQLLLLEGDMREACRKVGLSLRVGVVKMRRGKSCTETFHWMFETEGGRRLLDYWPVKGTWWSQKTVEKGNTQDPFEALEIARRLSYGDPAIIERAGAREDVP